MQQLENTIVEKQGGQLPCFWVGWLETFEHELQQRLVVFVATDVDNFHVVQAMNRHFGADKASTWQIGVYGLFEERAG